jgi:hypothetical protein
MEVVNLANNNIQYPPLNYTRLHQENLLPNPTENISLIMNEIEIFDTDDVVFNTFIVNFIDRITEDVPVGIPHAQLIIPYNVFTGISNNFHLLTDEFIIRRPNTNEEIIVFAVISENHQYPFLLVDVSDIDYNIEEFSDITQINMTERGINFIDNLNRLLI